MNPIAPVQGSLQDLPTPVRRTLYWGVVLLGLALTALQAGGIDHVGSVTVEQGLKVFAFLSPLVGCVAASNGGRAAPDGSATGEAPGGLGSMVAGMDAEMSDFEPVGDIDDVYGPDAVLGEADLAGLSGMSDMTAD